MREVVYPFAQSLLSALPASWLWPVLGASAWSVGGGLWTPSSLSDLPGHILPQVFRGRPNVVEDGTAGVLAELMAVVVSVGRCDHTGSPRSRPGAGADELCEVVCLSARSLPSALPASWLWPVPGSSAWSVGGGSETPSSLSDLPGHILPPVFRGRPNVVEDGIVGVLAELLAVAVSVGGCDHTGSPRSRPGAGADGLCEVVCLSARSLLSAPPASWLWPVLGSSAWSVGGES